MALPRKYNVDTRVFKSGTPNPFLNNASTYNLNDIISQVVLNTIPGNTQLPFIFSNGITDTYVPGSGTTVTWGGSLNQNTTVDGGSSHSVSFLNLSRFQINSSNTSNIIGDVAASLQSNGTAVVKGVTQLHLRTPNVNGSTAAQGQILQLIDPASNLGIAEYTPYALPIADGIAGQELITDGSGTVSWSDKYSNLHSHIVDSNVEISTVVLASTVRNIAIPGSLNGWEIDSLHLVSASTGGAVVDANFELSINGGTALLTSNFAGGVSTYDGIPVNTLSTGDYITFEITGNGADIFGLDLTITFKNK
jgi:hypothetical protein